MYGILVGLGRPAGLVSHQLISRLWPTSEKFVVHNPGPNISMAILTPKGDNPEDYCAISPDSRFLLGLNGYILADSNVSGQARHLQLLAESFQKGDFAKGLEGLVAGSFNLAVIDTSRMKIRVYSDPAGSVPLYYSQVEGGVLLSNNPVALIKTGLVDTAPDITACAEWALFSHTIGDKYPIKAIRTLRVGEFYEWNGDGSRIMSYDRLWDRLPTVKAPELSDIADEFKAACGRIRLIDDNPAQLQSAGMDSRLIAAAWPDEKRLRSYSYGNPDSHEIIIAKQIAMTRGASWTHTWQHGDLVADKLQDMYDNTGMIIWPDRFFVAEKMAAEGHRGTLDGLAGDALLGGSDYIHNRYLGKNKQLNRWLCRFEDYDIKDVGLDFLTEIMYDKHLQIPSADYLRPYVSDEYIQQLNNAIDDIKASIHAEMEYLMPPNNSVALLWRNFIYANRAPHMTIHQGLMCNRFVQVYYPFISDFRFHDMAFRLRPEDTAYRRLYRKLYCNCFPEFANIPYGASLLPLTRPNWNHKLAAMMASKHKSIPWLTAPTNGRPRDPNGWAIWMKESAKMRDFVSTALAEGGIIDRQRCDTFMQDVAEGRAQAGGKIFHVASLAKWHSFSNVNKISPVIQ
ncbi:MAG: asparagine synthase-related protein [Candidatus Zixiibacteriota bacterium]